MRINRAIETVKKERPTLAGEDCFLLWLTTLDGRVQTDIFGLSPKETLKYTAEDIKNDAELLIPSPYDVCYIHYLSAMIDVENGEFERYANDYELFNAAFDDYAKYCQRNALCKSKLFEFRGW